MKPLILALAFFLLAPMINGQTKSKTTVESCALTIEKAPEVRGMRLGQDRSALQAVFGDEYGTLIKRIQFLDLRTDDIGRRIVRIINSALYKSETLKGTRALTLTYLDDRLESISIHYDDSVTWQSSAHFAEAIAEQLQLPRTGWADEVVPRLTCEGFFVEVFAGGSSATLRIESTKFESEIAKRKASLEQKKRAEFKP